MKKHINLIKQSHSLLIVASLAISMINVFTYESFFSRHFYIEPLTVYILFVISSFLVKTYDNKQKNRTKNFVNLFYLISAISFAVLYLLFNIIESLTYTNFVFSKLHINYELLIYPSSILIIEYIFSLNIKNANAKIKNSFYKLLQINTIAIPFVVLILINNISGIFSRIQKDVSFMLTNINASKDQVYEYKLGKQFYQYTKFVNANTPENSKILIPPFPAYPWPQTGNAVYLRYFLTPRVLYSGEEHKPGINIQDFDYVLIAWGETPTTSGNYTHGWPKFDVPAEYSIYLQDDGSTVQEYGNYIASKQNEKIRWGIIKIDKKK